MFLWTAGCTQEKEPQTTVTMISHDPEPHLASCMGPQVPSLLPAKSTPCPSQESQSVVLILAPFIPCVVMPCHRFYLFFLINLLVPVLPPRPRFLGLRSIFILNALKQSCGLEPPLALFSPFPPCDLGLSLCLREIHFRLKSTYWSQNHNVWDYTTGRDCRFYIFYLHLSKLSNNLR